MSTFSDALTNAGVTTQVRGLKPDALLLFSDVIMDMFQAPTLLDDPFGNASVLRAAEKESDAADSRKGKRAAGL